MKLWPTSKQWKRWSLPAKLTALSALIGVVGVLLAVVFGIASRWPAARLVEQASKIHGELTEGDTYGFVRFFYGEPGTFQMLFENHGPHTLHSIQIRMVDLTELQNIEESLAGRPLPWPDHLFGSSEITFNIGELGPGQVRKIGVVRLPEDSHRHGVNIWITTRFRTFVEEARFRRTRDRWMPAFRLVEATGDQIVTRHISIEGFPTDSCERPIWDWPGGPDGGQEALEAKWGPCASDPQQLRMIRELEGD